MEQEVNYKVNPAENIYFVISIIMSLLIYAVVFMGLYTIANSENPRVAMLIPLSVYVALFAIYLFFRFGVFIGHLKGNAIRVTQSQFPDIRETVLRQAKLLGLRRMPSVYILQSGGLLNAFATRFLGSNYIVLYSEVVEAAYESDENLLGFIIGHELGHIRRRHMAKRMFLFPSYMVPFLGAAYSRACEYTCDQVGLALCPEGAQNGMLLLVSGRQLMGKVSPAEFLKQEDTEDGFWKWFAEKVSSHPHATRRIGKLGKLSEPLPAVRAEITESDHSKYMPK
jgi:Zn-dependent protease with chaperone function